MTPIQLRKAIDKLGFRSAYEFGAWINPQNADSGRRATRRWLAGTSDIPPSVELAIELKLSMGESK